MINIRLIRQVGVLRWAVRYFMRQFTKRILRRDNWMRLPTGSMICLPRNNHCATEVYVMQANIDWGSEALFSRLAMKDRDFIDIGANIGYYSLYLSPLVRKVYAFEPDPRNIPSLQTNASLVDNIEILQMAVSSKSGDSQLDVSGGSTVSSLNHPSGKMITVQVTSLDDYLARYPKLDPSLIKIDIEGHDFEALKGMTQTVERCQPLILTECDTYTELPNLCVKWNYSIFAYVRDWDRNRTEFRHMTSSEELLNHSCKMLFLVPQRLVSTFIDHEKNHRHQ